MKIRLLAAGLPVVVIALSAVVPAVAKGPAEATISGPGLKGGGIHLSSGTGGDPRSGTPLGNLVELGGYFPATFGQQPDPMLSKQPNGELGPKYEVEYQVPGPRGRTATIRQDLYPYATPSPLTYTTPGQPFFDGEQTHGGWYVAQEYLKLALVDAGLPRNAPSGGSGDSWLPSFDAMTVLIGVAGALALVAIAFAAMRRRPRPAGA
jgi:hypothetical protein